MTIGLQTTRRLVAAATCTLLLAGCASRDAISSHDKEEKALRAKYLAMQTERESVFNLIWQGRPYEELRQHLGDPPLKMNVIGARPLRTSLVVYPETINEAHCIDAFTMVKIESNGQWIVADYFCR